MFTCHHCSVVVFPFLYFVMDVCHKSFRAVKSCGSGRTPPRVCNHCHCVSWQKKKKAVRRCCKEERWVICTSLNPSLSSPPHVNVKGLASPRQHEASPLSSELERERARERAIGSLYWFSFRVDTVLWPKCAPVIDVASPGCCVS